MKAIILAGGSGTRLYPVSLGTPKPMVNLIDKPMLEHIIELLKKNGLTDICVTLRYLPKIITDYFRDGSSWGVNLESHIEDKALGTAGGIKACAEFLDGSDFLVISGDAACDIDLRELIARHYENSAEATIALYRSDKPLEYGLVMTGPGGRVERFIEKPSRDRVYTDLVNTGIYVISNKLLSEIPDNTEYDFAKDLFPKLLSQGRGIYGVLSTGYWCDVGSCESYLGANFDALSGELRIEYKTGAETKSGIRSETEINPEAVYRAPCYIGEGAVIGKGAVIGPYAVIGRGSIVGAKSVVKNSIVDGAVIDEEVRLSGAIVCRSARIGSGSRLMEGSVIGEGSVISSGCLIAEGVKVWPEKKIPAGMKLKRSLVSGMPKSVPLFEVRGCISGEIGVDITPELCLRMGSAVNGGSIGIAHSGGEFARIYAECFSCGAAAAGAQILYFDAAIAATAAVSARLYNLELMCFAEQKDKRVRLLFYNKRGQSIDRDTERKLESAFSSDGITADSSGAGSKSSVTGTGEAHSADACRCIMDAGVSASKIRVAVTGRNQAQRLMKRTLEMSGICTVDTTAEQGIAELGITADGMRLSLQDENGRYWEHGRLLTALALAELEYGRGSVVLPYTAPAASEVLVSRMGGRVLRLGRDGQEAELEMMRYPYASDGIYLSVRLLSALRYYGNSFASLMERVPEYFIADREVRVSIDRGRLMRQLCGSGQRAEYVSGIKLELSGGYAHVTPAAENLLKIRAEGATAEIAEELCVEVEKRVREASAKNDLGKSY